MKDNFTAEQGSVGVNGMEQMKESIEFLKRMCSKYFGVAS